MKKYPKYKDSGVEWIGEVPEGWNNYALKRLVGIKITDGPHETPDFVENGVPFISAESVKDSKIDFNFKRGFISKEQDIVYSKKCKPKKHDIFIVKSGSTTGKIAIVDTDEDFNIWSPLALVRSNPKLAFPNFLFYAFICDYFQRQIQLFWSFGTQPNIGMGVIESLRVILPSLPEQTVIAAYLDRKTAQIDQTIAEKEKLIELFREERQAIINHAVTKGIRPGVKMKDSGVAWIGEVPEGWEVKKLKYVALINPSKRSGEFDLKSEELVTFLAMENVSEGGKIDCRQKKPVHALVNGYTYFEKNDVIIAKITPCFENGKGALLNELDTPIGFGSTEFHVLRATEKISKELLFFISRTTPFMQIGEAFMVGSAGQKRVPTNFIENWQIGLPPLPEQTAIVNYLDQKTTQIDAAILGIQQEIALLQEYRQALIFEAVTGKIDVRDTI